MPTYDNYHYIQFHVTLGRITVKIFANAKINLNPFHNLGTLVNSTTKLSECNSRQSIRSATDEYILAAKPGIYGLAFTMGIWFLTDNSATVGRILMIFLAHPHGISILMKW